MARKLELDPWQQEFIDTKGDKILCCGRQVGKTEICSQDAAEWAVKAQNQNILMIAPTERQAYQLFEKTLEYLLTNHRKMIKKGKDRPTKTKIELINGVKIYCLPTGIAGLGIRGLTVGRLYVDEASRIPEEVWAAVTPMLLTTGGDTILLSTPYGARGEFYKVWINQDNAYESFTKFSVTSEIVINERKISETWTERQRIQALKVIEQAKTRMSKREYAQEYLGEFLDELSRYFTDELIKRCCIGKREPYHSSGFYFLGVDIARLGEDKSAFQIIDKKSKTNLVHVESIITKSTLTTETENRIIELDKIYDFQKIYIDAGAGSLGVSVFDHLLDNDQTKRKVEAINNRSRSYDREDKQKTRLLKEDLYDNLRSLMERGFIKLLDDDELIDGLRSIQYEFIQAEGKPTRIRIFASPHNAGDIVEGLIRAAWCVKDKNLNIWISSFSI